MDFYTLCVCGMSIRAVRSARASRVKSCRGMHVLCLLKLTSRKSAGALPRSVRFGASEVHFGTTSQSMLALVASAAHGLTLSSSCAIPSVTPSRAFELLATPSTWAEASLFTSSAWASPCRSRPQELLALSCVASCLVPHQSRLGRSVARCRLPFGRARAAARGQRRLTIFACGHVQCSGRDA